MSDIQSIRDKINAIYLDLSANVTYIYQRQNIHLAIDLVYHSPLQIKFERRIIKGYPELLIVGDTKCGKSETAQRLLQHYGLGSMSTGETSTFAGLVGAVQQVRGSWQIIWGKIPYNNERLLIMDEVSGLSPQDIENMSTIRSSGIADISKAKSGTVSARTRLVWIANPRQGTSLEHFASGINIIRQLIGKPEDISRFDFAIVVSANEVDDDVINDPGLPDVPHIYTSQACHNLILWAWTLSPEQVIIGEETIAACKEYAKKMYTKYSKDFPIVNAAEQKIKLARLASALSCRLYNSPDYGRTVRVEPCHVEFVYEFLNQEYDRPSFNYDVWSKSRIKAQTLKSPKEVYDILYQIGPVGVNQILESYQISVKSIANSLAVEDAEARLHIHTLINSGAITSYHSYYVKSPGFIRLIKQFLNDPRPTEEMEF